MRPLSRPRWLALLCVLLTACATSALGERGDDEAQESMSSWEEAREDPSCVVPQCDEARCALWRCQDLVEVDEAPPAVVLARGPMPQAMRPPLVGTPGRWWGRTLAAPSYQEPVFEIPWHNRKTREQLAQQRRHPLGCMLPPEPLEKHHIFPQAQELAEWFKTKRIDIHAFTISLPKSVHRRLHSGEPKGGQWNAAWRQFRDENNGATAEEVWRFAFELMLRFGVNGPLTSYYCQG
ncbi:TIGR02269 family lipoprotein [Cystobacter fuscus]|uniref:SitA6 family polymorphic toxin lipoprotein n=1 Tax=Cystobacter fuscus TaxID=43 RepID=UPI0037BF16E2